jgi:hypothetical protein
VPEMKTCFAESCLPEDPRRLGCRNFARAYFRLRTISRATCHLGSRAALELGGWHVGSVPDAEINAASLRNCAGDQLHGLHIAIAVATMALRSESLRPHPDARA